MNGICQGLSWFLTIAGAFGFAASVTRAHTPLREAAGNELPVHLTPLPASDFAGLRWEHPELAACAVLAGALPQAQSGIEPPNGEALVRALRQLVGTVTRELPPGLEVFYGFSPQPTATATAFGNTVLLALPESEPTSPADAARSAVSAWLAAHRTWVAPQDGVSEPLLRLGESLAWLGSLALANTPPQLLPLAQWVDPKTVAPALEQFVRQSLDPKEPYLRRRTRLREVTLPGRASPELAQAAAFLVETFGQPDLARRDPMVLLKAWAENRDKRFPPPPRALRSALEQPARAGMPRKLEGDDAEALRADAALRAAWALPPSQALPGNAPQEAVSLWYARRRAQGLSAPVPEGLGHRQGICVARPEPPGFAVSWQANGREELLLVWPRWVLSPHLTASGNELVFADPDGVWRVSLAGTGAENVQAGSFRSAGASPSGKMLAASIFPSGEVATLPAGKTLGAAKAWVFLDEGVLLLAEAQELVVVGLEGERGARFPVPCPHALASARSKVLVATGAPCTPALVSLDLATGEQATLLKVNQAVADVVPWGQGWGFLTMDGVFLLSPEGTAKRLHRAFSLGPG